MKLEQPGQDSIGKLHVISTGQQPGEELMRIIGQVLPYVDSVHLREKEWSDRQMICFTQQLYSVGMPMHKLILNHRATIADKVKAKGVQLTHASMNQVKVRRLYPDLTIGCSVQEAVRAWHDGADYLIFGHVFTSSSKPGLSPKGIRELKKVVQHVRVPVLAIGGITPENTNVVMEAGASGVAVLSGVLLADDPVEKAVAYREAIRKGGAGNV
ncbi:thiamine phosphate synthase [Salimicrobium salexigens]|uniref:Thiazole tautomerase (Transcriptional regulator TenI) n=1 Tax=Salimicrobium salexigens TaxID=908941 RepID=A0ABY1KVX2_9BACI|nr:thiamine phosphate synthase [Salimicrobium salexigens]SIS75310.1 thiazole tautomerase (transcriptional regulator TenI) [Salimicrobium salexigens]